MQRPGLPWLLARMVGDRLAIKKAQQPCWLEKLLSLHYWFIWSFFLVSSISLFPILTDTTWTRSCATVSTGHRNRHTVKIPVCFCRPNRGTPPGISGNICWGQDGGERHLYLERQVSQTRRCMGVGSLGDSTAESPGGSLARRFSAAIGDGQDDYHRFGQYSRALDQIRLCLEHRAIDGRVRRETVTACCHLATGAFRCGYGRK